MIILFIILYHRADIKFGKKEGRRREEREREKKKERRIRMINNIG